MSWFATRVSWAGAMIGSRWRYFETARGAPPVEVGTTSAPAPISPARLTAACMTAPAADSGSTLSARPWITGEASAASAISAIVVTASTG